jgi:hypothetical protein
METALRVLIAEDHKDTATSLGTLLRRVQSRPTEIFRRKVG